MQSGHSEVEIFGEHSTVINSVEGSMRAGDHMSTVRLFMKIKEPNERLSPISTEEGPRRAGTKCTHTKKTYRKHTHRKIFTCLYLKKCKSKDSNI